MDVVYQVQVDEKSVRSLNKKKKAEVLLHRTQIKDLYFISRFSYQALKKQKIPHQVTNKYSKQQLPVQIIFPSQSCLFEAPDSSAQEEISAYAMAQQPHSRHIQVLYLGRDHPFEKGLITLDRPQGRRAYQWKISKPQVAIQDVRHMFPSICRKIKDRKTKVILSLGSGGIRLFAHPSLLKFIDLMELRPFIDEIWGSSGGAIAGLPYATGIPPQQIEQEGFNLYNERHSFQLSPSKFQVLKNLVSDKLLGSSDHLLRGFLDCQQALQGLISKHIGTHPRRIPFYCIAYNLKERRSEVLTPEEVDSSLYLTPILQTDALDAVIASSAVPIVYVPKKIRRGDQIHQYIDGGTTEEVPLISPYRKWTRDRFHKKEKRKKLLIIAVNLFPEIGSSRIFNHWVFQKIPAFRLLELSATYTDLVRQARVDEHKGHLARDPNVTVWELKLPLKGTGVVDTKRIPKVIKTAQYSFFKQLLELERRLK